jgi:hypothetical protein
MRPMNWKLSAARLAGLSVTAIVPLALSLLGLPTPGVAHEDQPPAPALVPAGDLVPFSATGVGKVEGFSVQVVPPVATGRVVGTGEGKILGQTIPLTTASIGIGNLTLDGRPLSVKEAHAVFTTPTGDAIFANYSGVFRAPLATGRLPYEGVITITGGRGRFLGAAGHGEFRGELDILTGTATISGEGLVTRPKA